MRVRFLLAVWSTPVVIVSKTQCIVGCGPKLKLIQDGGERQAEDRACCRKALNEVFNRKFFVSVFFFNTETNVVLK